MIEIIFTIIFLIGLIGMGVIIFQKIPVLVELSPAKAKKLVVFEKLKKGAKLHRISFSPELLLQKILSKIRDLTFRTEKKLLKKALEKKNKFSDDFWQKVRGEK